MLPSGSVSDSALLNSFVQARHYTAGGNFPPTRVVIHDEEYPEKGSASEDIGAFFSGPNAPQASAHTAVDNNSIVGCVHEVDTAWHAPPNAHSLGIEHAGYSNQGAAGWADDYSETMLRLSAKLTADYCARYGIPVVWLSVQDLLAGKHGITSHNNVSQAWHQSTHSDPGPDFPVQHYLDLVNAELGVHPLPTPEGNVQQTRFYKIRDESNISQPAPSPKGDAIYVTTDEVHSKFVDGEAWVHMKNLGWWDESKVELIPETLHDWLLGSGGGN